MKAVEIVIEMKGGIIQNMCAFHRKHPTKGSDLELPVIYLFDHDNAESDVEDERDRSLTPVEFSKNMFPHRTAEDFINELLAKYEET